MERVCREVCRSVKGVKAMKLTIEGLLDKWGYKQDEVWHRAQIRADIQAYVKQEMRKIVPKAINDIQDTINATEGMFEPEVEAIAYEAGWGACICSILSAIENYGKDKGGL